MATQTAATTKPVAIHNLDVALAVIALAQLMVVLDSGR
jgi:hypothetical protein